ncbi:FAD-dependent monooxygenase [Rhodoligotrophos defluvii]|uniref:FAD-dependent monooxygenase n=1 Tax=Rhodoligotrophos defluvii TaxID=2561934 RepID=UPI0010C936A6|nr:FAD-dependent monooxygenase [Rhodoligotrophos defluvii]
MAGLLVVGAGPVGLTLAAELARHGTRARIIDKAPVPLPYCRAIGVTPRTLEVWDDMGLVRDAIDAGLWLRGTRMIIAGRSLPDQANDFADLPYAELGLPQYETERLLTGQLARHGIAVERGVELVSAIEGDGSVAVSLSHADGRSETADFDYVIGCDGAHSAVRHVAGIGFEGDAFPFSFMLGDVHIAWADPQAALPRGYALFCLDPKEDSAPDMFIAIPLPERNRYRVSMLAGEDAAADQPGETEHGLQTERPGPPLSALQAVADRLLPQPARLSDLRWSSNFRISMRLAQRYRKGRLFIAGDAAHIHPPTGGQGMNTGIQDAYNLAWKLALVANGLADPALLDSYEEERRPVGADVIARTREASLQMGRGGGKRDRMADTQLLISYRASSWVHDDGRNLSGPAAGDRAPDVTGLVREGVGAPLRLFDMLRGTSHVLLAWVDAPAEAAAAEARIGGLKQAWGERIRVVLVAPPEHAIGDVVGAAVLRDSTGAYQKTYGADAYLIRPDKHVGWKGPRYDSAGLDRYCAHVFGSDLKRSG